jgi:hypothetical protein
MDNFDDIKKVWLSANVSALPKAADILHLIKKFRRRQILKTSGSVLLTLLLTAILIWVLFSYHSNMITTRIGEACMLCALMILLQVNIKSLKRITASKTYANNDFLLFLKQEQVRCARYRRYTQLIGFIIANLGLSFYIFEEVHKNPLTALICYAGVLVWCLFCWFIIRPIATRRQGKHLNETILQLELYTMQLERQ